MGARTLYSSMAWVAYGQLYVQSSDDFPPSLDRVFGGQENGLCGAAVPGGLFLVTGLHTGRVKLTVEAHDAAPALGDSWEEVVEVSFRPLTRRVWLAEWGGGDGEGPVPLSLGPGDWRARYCATGMDTADSSEEPGDEESAECYLLQFWLAPPSGDRVVRQTSARAAYWHDYARQLPLPPPLPTAEELDEAERQEQNKRRAAQERFEVQRYWGGRRPSDRLRHVGGNVLGVAERDRGLLDELDRADPHVQRAVAVWAAHRACEIAGLASTDWVAAGLDALDRGEPLSAPFDHLSNAFARLRARRAGHTKITISIKRSDAEQSLRRDLRYFALPAIPAAAHPDPLRAAIDALSAAGSTSGDEDRLLFDEVRHTFLTNR